MAGPTTLRAQPKSRPVPCRSSEFAHLSLPALREYRRALDTEEDRVSYWRRLIQARLDLLRAGRDGAMTMQSAQRVLTQERVGRGRLALLAIVPRDDMPPLPELARLWSAEADAGEPAALARLERELVQAEAELSAYRASLHRRLAAATGELIARYREDPALCLTVLPTLPEQRCETA